MPSPNSVFTELVTTTYRNHRAEFKDNISKNNAWMRRVYGKGRYRTEDGGLSIVEPLDYAANNTYQRFSGYDLLNVSASDVLSAAEFQWRQIAIHVVANGQELRTNSGKSNIIKLAKSRMTNAMRTFKNNFSLDMYGDGTLPNQINGLQALVSDTGLGTVGGIDSSVWPFWQNVVQSAAAPLQGGGAITPGPTTMESLMLPLWLTLIRGDDAPDLILCDNNYYSFYEQSQTSLKRYTDDTKANGGFTSLKYKSADVVFDGGSGIPENRMYFLNSDFMGMVVHKDADMEVLDEMRPYNQDSAIIPILMMCNMTVSNRSLQGVLKP